MIPHAQWSLGAVRLVALHFGAQASVRGIGGLNGRLILIDRRERTRTCLIRTAMFGATDLYVEVDDLGWRMACHYADPMAIRKPLWTARHDEDMTEGWSEDPRKAGRARPGLEALERAFDALAGERRRAA